MDCQRAEAHLRLLAEEELRRPASAWGERQIRVGRVAELLMAIGALDNEVADRIVADFGVSLAARQADARYRRVLLGRSLRRSPVVRSGPAMHAGGPMNQASYPVGELYYWPVTWIRDSGGRWHATRTLGSSSPNAGGSALRMEMVPPLSRATTGIEVIATGRLAEARARLPLHWE